MPSFNRVLLAGTAYQASATLQDVFGGRTGTPGGAFLVENGNVWYELQYPVQSSGMARNLSGYGENAWTSEVLLAPGSGQIPPGVIGVKFRNDDSTFPATVSAAIPEPNTPVLVLSGLGTQASTMISGRVSAAGAIQAGTGFTVAVVGAGVYEITFSTVFASQPIFLYGPIDAATPNWQILSASSDATKIRFSNGAAVGVDFNFIAQAVS